MRKWLLAGAALLSAQTANAAVTTVSASFNATNWSVLFGTPAPPIDPLFLRYSVTFDDSLNYASDTSVLTVNATNIPYAFSFSYGAGNSIFTLATAGGAGSCGHPASSFCAFVDRFTGMPFFVEQSPENGGGWIAGTITAAAAVPEPATWAMMILGFGMIGSAMRRRQPLRVTYA